MMVVVTVAGTIRTRRRRGGACRIAGTTCVMSAGITVTVTMVVVVAATVVAATMVAATMVVVVAVVVRAVAA